eukprot:1672143-Ditylum_brightwellii.AAC.1
MKNCSPTVAPTSVPKSLGPDLHGKDVQLHDKWSYSSMVGMMMYLASNSRQEIPFDVHQCSSREQDLMTLSSSKHEGDVA